MQTLLQNEVNLLNLSEELWLIEQNVHEFGTFKHWENILKIAGEEKAKQAINDFLKNVWLK